METMGEDNNTAPVGDDGAGEIYRKLARNIKRILVVDDIHYVIKSITSVLSKEGYIVFSASTGKEALEQFKKHRPHLVTVDQKLPDMTGFQLVEKMRTLEGGQDVKIIFISAVHAKEEIQAILNLGIANYILKPFKKEKLIACARELLSS